MLVLGEDGQDVAVDAPSDAYLTLGGLGFRASLLQNPSLLVHSVNFEHRSEHIIGVRRNAA